jgi:hypothetical protein
LELSAEQGWPPLGTEKQHYVCLAELLAFYGSVATAVFAKVK